MRRKVLLVDPFFHQEGGAPVVAAWSIEALRYKYDVTVLAWLDFAVDRLNRLYGTSLRAGDFTLLRPSRPVRMVGNAIRAIDPDPYSVQRWAMLIRMARGMRERFDVTISTHGETDFGGPCIQYVHYPYLDGAMGRRRPWQIVAGFSFERMKANRTLANSNWTGDRFRTSYGRAAFTLYPPVPGEYPDVPWEERENGAVCIGRFAGDKNLNRLIDIVAAVRRHHPEFHLHMIGMPTPNERGSTEYYRRLRERAGRNSDWLFLEECISREALVRLVSHHRYGLHGKIDEHFGIAVAEMVKAGCIVFTHRSGGQIEIVNDDRLLYTDTEDGVERVLDVIQTEGRQQALRRHLAAQQRVFSPERFMRELLGHVDVFIRGESELHPAELTCN